MRVFVVSVVKDPVARQGSQDMLRMTEKLGTWPP